MIVSMKFTEKVARLCEAKKLSQREVARALGDVNKDTVNRWFTGKATPDMREGLMLARLLEVPYEFLADDAIDEPASIRSEPSEDERFILQAVQMLGVEEAKRRLVQTRTDLIGRLSSLPILILKEVRNLLKADLNLNNESSQILINTTDDENLLDNLRYDLARMTYYEKVLSGEVAPEVSPADLEEYERILEEIAPSTLATYERLKSRIEQPRWPVAKPAKTRGRGRQGPA